MLLVVPPPWLLPGLDVSPLLVPPTPPIPSSGPSPVVLSPPLACAWPDSRNDKLHYLWRVDSIHVLHLVCGMGVPFRNCFVRMKNKGSEKSTLSPRVCRTVQWVVRTSISTPASAAETKIPCTTSGKLLLLPPLPPRFILALILFHPPPMPPPTSLLMGMFFAWQWFFQRGFHSATKLDSFPSRTANTPRKLYTGRA